MGKKVLVVGGGGRCHAIVDALSRSPKVSKIYCAPRNAGIAAQAECVPLKDTQIEELKKFAVDNSVDLTVVGPEASLAAGIADVFHAAGLRIFGPSKKSLRNYLKEHSLVVIKDGNTNFYEGRGVSPLMNYLVKDNFENAYVADKRIGKASALLLVYGKARKVYTPVITKPAVKVFEENDVNYSADKVVDNFLNNKGTDICPIEKKVQNIDNPAEAYELFRNF